MRLHHALIAQSLLAALAVCSAAQNGQSATRPAKASAPATRPAQAPASAAAPAVAASMASFAHLVGGEWKVTAASGTSMYDAWHWGPGQHSLRVMTDGQGADGGPWRGLGVVYWHPGRKQVCSLGLSPFAAGVSEGTITFDGETADGIFDMHQTGGLRKLRSRWTFDGPDKYRDELLEATGPGGYLPLAAWDRFRVAPPATPRPRAVDGAPRPSERLRALEPLLDQNWEARGEAKGDWGAGGDLHIRSTVEWVPLANGIYIRTLARAADAEPTHVLDAYVYHHTGANRLRCLALSHRGGVYEGDITVLDGGALQLDLDGYEGDRVVRHDVRVHFDEDGTLRQRVWSLEGGERTLVLDVRHKKLGPN